uniref:Similar to NRPB1 (RNA POLYMERASE II LARGE SUBUNIT) n=1 Tax=Arundo donax TaxID=35708 RepID=A0A0A9E4A9_ARUDO
MPHDGHFVKTRLPIEENKISIIEVPLHLVTKLQMLITAFLHISKIKPLTIFSDNIPCTCLPRGRMRPIFHKFFQPLNVIWGDSFWVCQVQSNTPWYSQFINVNIWIWCDNSAG